MKDCCVVRGQPEPLACPGCGRRGWTVPVATLRALLHPTSLARVADAQHSFCASGSCPVVYFGRTDRFAAEDVTVPIFQKESGPDRMVCYCLRINEDDLRRERRVGTRPDAFARITALVQAGLCACDVKNPQGRCCLGNVATALQPGQEDASAPHRDAVAVDERGVS